MDGTKDNALKEPVESQVILTAPEANEPIAEEAIPGKAEQAEAQVETPAQEEQSSGTEQLSQTGIVDEAFAREGAEQDVGDLPKKGKRKGKKKRRRIYEYTLDDDMRYRGPLSYLHLRIFAWGFLIIAQLGVLLALGSKFDSGFAGKVGPLPNILQSGSTVMMPLFLIATFATILNGSRSFKSMLTLYGGLSVVFYLLFILFHNRYLPSIIGWVMGVERAEAVATIDGMLYLFSKGGYLAFNIFIDLFLCTLLTFFLIYRPKKVFVGKKLIIFRLFALIPILYEGASLALKMLGMFGKIVVSSYLYPLLTTKPPMTFVVFVVIAFLIKAGERRYRKVGKTHEEYQDFVKTNAHSWQFSRTLAITMAVAGVIDLIIYLILTLVILHNAGFSGTEEQVTQMALLVSDVLINAGVGGSGALILVAPLVLLFSYTKTHKKSMINLILPAAAIIIIIFMYLEAAVIATKLLGPFGDFVGKLLNK